MSKRFEPRGNEFQSVIDSIRGIEPEEDFADRIMDKIKEQHLKPVSMVKRKKRVRRRVIASTIAAGLAAIIGSGFVSPAMADSLQQVPGVRSIFKLAGDLGLRTAATEHLVQSPHATVSGGNFSLSIPEIIYDGTRVSLSLERLSNSDSAVEEGTLKEAIKSIDLLINDQDIQTYGPGNTNSIGIFQYAGADKDSVIVEFSDLRNQEGKVLPDSFDLKVNVSLADSDEAFSIEVPVVKNATDMLVKDIESTKQTEDFAISYKKIELTPVTTNLSTVLTLPEGEVYDPLKLSVSYDVIDEQGNVLKLLSSNEWHESNGNELISDIRLQPFETTPEKITIRPYLIAFTDEGTLEYDADGNIAKRYLKELEVEVPVEN